MKRFKKIKKRDNTDDVENTSKFVNKMLLKTNDEFLKRKIKAHQNVQESKK